MMMLTNLPRIILLTTIIGISACGGNHTSVRAAVNSSSDTHAAATINDIRMWHAPDRSRIVFDMNRRAEFELTTLDKPGRVVIDLTNTNEK